MPRVVRHPEVRRAEILGHATAAFVQRGFDNVSLNELIADAGVSKGAFYHWFSSKDELVTAMAEGASQQHLEAVQRAVAECTGTALDRLNAALRAGFHSKMESGTPEKLGAMVSLLRPENAYLYSRIVVAGEAATGPVLTRLISEGVADGTFNTFDPAGVADMIQGLASRVSSNIVAIADAADESAREREIDILVTRLKLHGLAVDRILGLPDGSIAVLDQVQVETMVADLPLRALSD
ncbi:MAG: TetR/AcrR family transcriptional regulator [Mycolicibacterium sp.]|uniref:TetR/AcrR family transcriptional regulator n=1 Tax=Mycolicibacterium sp. TaxID=2320850 RepID=UPI003D129D9A